MDVMRWQHYALQRANKNRTLEEALADPKDHPEWPKINASIVTDFYTRILKLDPKQRPHEIRDSEALKKRIRIMREAGI
jgi:hypothetical protein